MAWIGEDFAAARGGWLYDTRPGQGLVAAALLSVALFLIYTVLQAVTGVLVFMFGLGGNFQQMAPESADQFAEAAILGLLPAALLMIFVTLRFARFWNPGPLSGIPLHVPRLGVLGWIILVLAFLGVMQIIFAGTFWVLGIDPQTYMPNGGSLGDPSSSAGLVEKVISKLAKQPLLFALALPGIAFAVPVVEEVIFRGALFSALTRSAVGKPGAVLISAAVWAVVHGASAPWLFVGLLFLMGIVMGLLLLRFGSLSVTILCHCIWNGLTSLTLFGLQHMPVAVPGT
jgi:membrane protease YdiL (CAAX protease family)